MLQKKKKNKATTDTKQVSENGSSVVVWFCENYAALKRINGTKLNKLKKNKQTNNAKQHTTKIVKKELMSENRSKFLLITIKQQHLQPKTKGKRQQENKKQQNNHKNNKTTRKPEKNNKNNKNNQKNHNKHDKKATTRKHTTKKLLVVKPMRIAVSVGCDEKN